MTTGNGLGSQIKISELRQDDLEYMENQLDIKSTLIIAKVKDQRRELVNLSSNINYDHSSGCREGVVERGSRRRGAKGCLVSWNEEDSTVQEKDAL